MKTFRRPPAFLRRPILVALLSVGVAGCAEPRTSVYNEAGRTAPQIRVERPDYPGYGAAVAKQGIKWSPASLAQDFVDLNFASEGGATFTGLPRWPAGVRLALIGPELSVYRDEVQALVDMINGAAPELRLALTDDATAEISIRTAELGQMRNVAPEAECFIVAGDYTLPAYEKAARNGDANDPWIVSGKATIFIPAHASPFVFRTCFAEEIIQALGPSNDLYSLEASLFNDDNVHVAPTSFDLLMLATLYAPELSAGMTRRDARRAAEAAIRRMGGAGREARIRTRRDDAYQAAAYRAHQSNDVRQRVRLFTEADEIARRLPLGDHRRGEAARELMWARHNAGDEIEAIAVGRRSLAAYEAMGDPDGVRLALVRSDLGFLLYLQDELDEAIALFEAAERVLAANAVEDELAFTIRLRALALEEAGRDAAAKAAAAQALAWARYAFGDDSAAAAGWRETFRRRRLGV